MHLNHNAVSRARDNEIHYDLHKVKQNLINAKYEKKNVEEG